MSVPSLNFRETTLSVTNNASQPLPLQFTDDDIALEQLEVVMLELSAVPSTRDECNIVHIEPHKTTIIYVEDDDSEFMHSHNVWPWNLSTMVIQ